jgi:hypothetical protein
MEQERGPVRSVAQRNRAITVSGAVHEGRRGGCRSPNCHAVLPTRCEMPASAALRNG